MTADEKRVRQRTYNRRWYHRNKRRANIQTKLAEQRKRLGPEAPAVRYLEKRLARTPVAPCPACGYRIKLCICKNDWRDSMTNILLSDFFRQ